MSDSAPTLITMHPSTLVGLIKVYLISSHLFLHCAYCTCSENILKCLPHLPQRNGLHVHLHHTLPSVNIQWDRKILSSLQIWQWTQYDRPVFITKHVTVNNSKRSHVSALLHSPAHLTYKLNFIPPNHLEHS